MKHIDEAQLETDLEFRYAYLAEFIGFTQADVAAIHGCVGLLAPLVPQMVDKTYEKLLAYDATARHFVPRQHGFQGPLSDSTDVSKLNDAQIKFRKEHLSRYLMSLLGRAYDAKMTSYLDVVGKMHTSKAGNQQIEVPLVQMNALMGLLSDILIETIATLDMPCDDRMKTIRAFTKILWIQNDLINRHYQDDTEPRDGGNSAGNA